MRPSLLDPLFADATSLDKVGAKTAELIRRVVPFDTTDRPVRVGDLIFILPHSLIDRRNRPGVAGGAEGAIVTLDLRVGRHQPQPHGKKNVPHRVFAFDDTGEIALTFFHANRAWLERTMPVGADIIVSGRMEWFNGRPSMVHPDHVALAENAADLPLLEPVYPLTAGLSGRILRRAINQSIKRMPKMPEWLDPAFMAKQTFPPFLDALQRLHEPPGLEDVMLENPARRRLAYDELLAGQLSLALVRARMKRQTGQPIVGNGNIRAEILQRLPYSLTNSQERALAEISSDLTDPDRMLRLLQGDVGSGKTIVALLAMAQAVEAGGQAALLAPTEVLARQHLATITPLLEPIGQKVAILTGREKGKQREEVLMGLADGSIGFVVGTHALFQEGVAFSNLLFAVIDEQHRFGVHQRLAMTAKGTAPDMLVMTATPIPRTLVLTAFGDMDVSQLAEKPAGRQPISTVSLPMERYDQLVERIENAVSQGQKVYWICPLVEESEEVELTAAEDRFEALRPTFGNRIGLVHGRMKGVEKDDAMAAFKSGQSRLLVATTVIEVGVDVPDATIMVVEHAERFGLAQLHQLRGRVGRGDKPSSCVLLYKVPLGEVAHRRLEVLRETEDGFVIAEEDLKLRGEGELLGTRQSGSPGFRVARMEAHGDLLPAARDDARLILQTDPQLQTERGEALRLLLYLFGRDEAVRLLSAG